jgi:hypothetical protein
MEDRKKGGGAKRIKRIRVASKRVTKSTIGTSNGSTT